jgi:hypothetical protein
MALERITQHVELGLLKIAAAYWGKPRISAALASLLREIQTLEDTIWAQFTLQHIATADRPRLIVMGKLIGQTSEGFGLEDLRTAIIARALANRSRGTGPDIGAVLVALVGAENFSFVWGAPALIYVTVLTALTDEQLRLIESVLPAALGAGVALHLFYSDAPGFMRWGDPWGGLWGSERAI